MLLADTGIRRAELAALRTDDVDLRTRVAYVVGKGRRPRTVPFGARTAQALDRYIRARRLNPLSELPAMWLAEKGRGVLTPDGIRQMLERRGRDIGVRVHAHMFRHGFADAWLRAGGSPNDLQELAGWRSPQMSTGTPRRTGPNGPATRTGVCHRWMRCEFCSAANTRTPDGRPHGESRLVTHRQAADERCGEPADA